MTHLSRSQHAELSSEQKFKMKKKLLSLGYTMHWQTPCSPVEVVMPRWQVCKNRIDAFMTEHGAIKKKMDEMSGSELVKAVTQLQQVTNDFLKKI